MQGGRGRARNLHDHQIGLASSRNESDCGSLAVTGGNILPGHIMATDDGLLFTPVSIGKLTLPGRLIKTATAETRASDDGFVTPELIDFYRPIARGGTPLIIPGNIYVSRDGKAAPRQLGADDDGKVPGLAQLAAAVHAQGSKLFAQLNHCGRQVVLDRKSTRMTPVTNAHLVLRILPAHKQTQRT